MPAINSSFATLTRQADRLAGLRAQADDLQRQVATGERLTAASDDPAAAARLRRLDRADARAQAFAGNASAAAADLAAADDALSAIGDELARARQLALQAANGTLSAAQLAVIGEELASLHDGLIALADSRGADGRALFAGVANGPAYARDVAGNAVYAGAAEVATIAVGEGDPVVRGVAGPEAFGAGGASVFALVKGLADALRAGEGAEAARAALPGFETASDPLSRAQGRIGAQAAWIEIVQDRQLVRSEARAAERADAGGTDIASAIARLQQVLTVLEASQASYVRVARLTLFDAI